MLDILIRLEGKRLSARRSVLRLLHHTGNSYLVIGLTLFIIAAVLAPLYPGMLGPLSIATGVLLVAGGLFILTLVLAPVGLFLL